MSSDTSLHLESSPSFLCIYSNNDNDGSWIIYKKQKILQNYSKYYNTIIKLKQKQIVYLLGEEGLGTGMGQNLELYHQRIHYCFPHHH